MREVHINDSEALDEVLKVFTSDVPVAVLEFPKVFGLFAPHSLSGAHALSRVKRRLPHKFYSSFLGDEATFRSMIPGRLHQFFDWLVREITGASFRLPLTTVIKHPDIATHKASHQFLLEKQSMRTFFYQLDKALQKIFPESDFYDANYQSPLVSSLNLSGAPSGSIIDKEEALSFAKKANVPLFIHTDNLEAGDLGSYPIFSITAHGQVSYVRKGLLQPTIEHQILAYFEQNPVNHSLDTSLK
jgi:hypothetical protein